MAQTLTLTAPESDFIAYVARPAGEVKGAVIVIHEIWGLVDHITGIADRLAAEGYLAIAPDLLSHIGVDASVGLELQQIMFATDPAVRTAGQPRLRDALAPLPSPEFAAWAVGALKATVDHLETEEGVDGRIAVMGFCFGGTYSYALASADSRIRAAIPFYGSGPSSDDAQSIGCPVLAFYGATDESLMTALPEVTAGLERAGVDFEAKVYDDAGHAFFNDTNPITYNAADAADAWTRTLSFLEGSLT
jgi:carboxymethylenebutenolidase